VEEKVRGRPKSTDGRIGAYAWSPEELGSREDARYVESMASARESDVPPFATAADTVAESCGLLSV